VTGVVISAIVRLADIESIYKNRFYNTISGYYFMDFLVLILHLAFGFILYKAAKEDYSHRKISNDNVIYLMTIALVVSYLFGTAWNYIAVFTLLFFINYVSESKLDKTYFGIGDMIIYPAFIIVAMTLSPTKAFGAFFLLSFAPLFITEGAHKWIFSKDQNKGIPLLLYTFFSYWMSMAVSYLMPSIV
jgi:hypothetical protein